ncbi:hypothetical protein G7046_g4362 [Stylonectria norvegica]|nr:hypothetical protein G7046_g4362 [Stylonectria norvegica]
MTTVAPVIALSHGGGPMPILGDSNHETIVYSLKNRVPKILQLGTPNQPRAIVLVTAHWQTNIPTISSSAKHDLYYDYSGFPKAAYAIKYPAPGSPEIAREIHDALEAEGLGAQLDAQRGWDHGVFVPLSLVLPKADIPIIQMSVLDSEDPESHLRMGSALAKLRESNIAIVGSGFASFHNGNIMRQLMRLGQEHRDQFHGKTVAWNAALTEATTLPDKAKRWAALKAWRSLPDANLMHPPSAGEHFMPLLVCAGAAADGEAAKRYSDEFLGVEINTYYWGAEEVK